MKTFKETLLLPHTSFSMKANLQKLEPAIQEFWNEQQIYQKLLKQNHKNQAKIIFDGPPYANGSIHLGTALNKIIKDVFVRYFFQNKYYSEFIFGWDVFGLPIENAVLKSLRFHHDLNNLQNQQKKRDGVLLLRRACKFFSDTHVLTQSEEFRSLGLLAPSDRHYKTSRESYVHEVLNIYEYLRHKQLIRKRFYPTWWSCMKQTSIAEADIVYQTISIQDALFSYQITNPEVIWSIDQPVFFLVWTSTVWTIPGNYMLAISKRNKYCLVKALESYYIVAKALIPALEAKLSIPKIIVISEIVDNSTLLLLNYFDPFQLKQKFVFFSDHVNEKYGTGVVHISPAHGRDDYLLAKKHKIKYRSVVNKSGRMVNTMFYDNMLIHKAIPQILERMRSYKMLLSSQWINHEFPFYKSTNDPLFILPTQQYFLEFQKAKKTLTKLCSQTHFYPNTTKKRLILNLESRSEWCISRQRYWGVPIPEIYMNQSSHDSRAEKAGLTKSKSHNANSDSTIGWKALSNTQFRYLKTSLQKNGIDIWFNLRNEDFFSQTDCLKIKSQKIDVVFESGILDVWFDSSCAIPNMLNKYQKQVQTKDLVLIEGLDQHRGWFNASFIMMNALGVSKGPQAVVTHGFVVDKNNIKMSKSLGNVISPLELVSKHGAEILRLFFSNNKFTQNVVVNQKNIDFSVANYRRIRNITRWLLGAAYLNHFRSCFLKDVLENDIISLKDKQYDGYNFLILKRLSALVEAYHNDMQKYELWKACHRIEDFLIFLSAGYAVYAKDILYIQPLESTERQTMVEIIMLIAVTLIKLLVPIIPHTCEEWYHCFQKEIIGNSKPLFVTRTSILLYPTLKKINFIGSKNTKHLSAFHDHISPIIQKLVNAAKKCQFRENNQKSFGKLETVDFWFIPTRKYKDLLTDKFVKLIFPFAQVHNLNTKKIDITPKHPIYSMITDPKLHKQAGEYFRYAVMTITEGDKCSRCWKYFFKENFSTAEQICCNCLAIVHTLAGQESVDKL